MIFAETVNFTYSDSIVESSPGIFAD